MVTTYRGQAWESSISGWCNELVVLANGHAEQDIGNQDSLARCERGHVDWGRGLDDLQSFASIAFTLLCKYLGYELYELCAQTIRA